VRMGRAEENFFSQFVRKVTESELGLWCTIVELG